MLNELTSKGIIYFLSNQSVKERLDCLDMTWCKMGFICTSRQNYTPQPGHLFFHYVMGCFQLFGKQNHHTCNIIMEIISPKHHGHHDL